MSRRTLRWAIPAAALPVLLLLGYGFRTDPREIPSPLIGKPAAPFTLKTFDDEYDEANNQEKRRSTQT